MHTFLALKGYSVDFMSLYASRLRKSLTHVVSSYLGGVAFQKMPCVHLKNGVIGGGRGYRATEWMADLRAPLQ